MFKMGFQKKKIIPGYGNIFDLFYKNETIFLSEQLISKLHLQNYLFI